MPTFTKKQRQIVDFIQKYQQEENLSPTLEEIGEALGITRMTVHEHIGRLEKKGLIRRSRNESRSIIIVDRQKEDTLSLPLLGKIAAGSPIEAIEDKEELDLRQILPPGAECYALKVKGDSMIEDGIQDGDYVLVEKTNTAFNGQTVVAIIDDNEATLKRYYREDNRIRLQPANSTMKPIYRQNVEIRGIVRGVYRSL